MPLNSSLNLFFFWERGGGGFYTPENHHDSLKQDCGNYEMFDCQL